MADAKDVLSVAVEFENFGAEYYLRFRDLVSDSGAKALMKGLAADEKGHAAILTRELQALGGNVKPVSGRELEKGLQEMFPERIEADDRGVDGYVSAIKMGIRTEERSIEYYSRNAGEAGPGLRDVFLKLEGMEREHLRLLQENLRQLEDDGSWLGYVPILEG